MMGVFDMVDNLIEINNPLIPINRDCWIFSIIL